MKGLTGDMWKNVRDSFERFGIFLYDSIGQKWLESLKWGMCQPAVKVFPARRCLCFGGRWRFWRPLTAVNCQRPRRRRAPLPPSVIPQVRS